MDGYFNMTCLGVREVLGPRSREHDGALSHQIEKRVGRLRVSTEMPARFAEHDFRRV